MNTEIIYKGISIPFPVESPFAMRPNMRLWMPGEKILRQDVLFQEYIEEKKKHYSPIYGNNISLDLLKTAVRSLKKYDHSIILDENQDGLVYRLTMSIQEDWVLFSNNQDGKLSAQMLSVHLPSGWDPKDKVNLTFAEIHEPVADNTLIMKASEHIASTISNKGPYVRHVWTISDSNDLSRRPDLISQKSITGINDLWYRCERQTTIPVEGKACLFLIRVYLAPLNEIFLNQEKKKIIIDSINTMSHAVLEYKNLIKVKEVINLHAV